MHTLRSVVIALILALLALPVFAARYEQSSTLTKTFTLTLHGNVPADRVFELRYITQAEIESGANPKVIRFCGGVDGPRVDLVISAAACAGNGTVYTAEVQLPYGSNLAYQYFTLLATDPQGTFEIFATNFQGQRPEGSEDFETLTGNVTNTASYDANRQAPGQMPDTGASSSISTGRSIAWIVVGISLLLVSGYALRKRRQLQA
jgi:hypothetical protein